MRLRSHFVLATALAMAAIWLSGPVLAQGAEEPPTVTLTLKDANLQQALDLLFRESGYRFQLEGGVSGVVNATLNDVSWDQTLRLILASQDLTYQVQDDVYRITRKPAGGAAAAPPLPPMATPAERISAGAPLSAPGGDTRLEVVKVQFSDPAMLAAIFGGQSVGYGWGGGGLSTYGIGGYGYGGYGRGTSGYGGLGGLGGLGGFGGLGYTGIPSYGGGYSAAVPSWGQGSWIGGALTGGLPR
jgi:hypothetical protein